MGVGFPGTAMNVIIPGSLYSVSVNASSYNSVIFTNSSGSSQTVDISFTSGNNEGVWAASGTSNSGLTGSFLTKKSINIGTATIQYYSSGWQDGPSMQIGGLASGENLFIYELGYRFAAGTETRVKVTVNSDQAAEGYYGVGTYYYGFTNYISSKPVYISEGNNSDTGSANSATSAPAVTTKGVLLNNGNTGGLDEGNARYNFYITTDYELSIAMVPNLGNGIYIMEYDEDLGTNNFINSIKMTSSSSYSASYSGFYVDASEADYKFFVRSYIDAVDTMFTVLVDNTEDDVASIDDGVVTITATDYYNISVSSGKIIVEDYEVNDFFALNPLDTSSCSEPSDIKAQKTSLVLQVDFTCANPYASIISLDARTQLSYIGCSFYVSSSELSDPYNTMRTDHYSLTSISTYTSVADRSNTPIPANSSAEYHAYILIDYVPGSNLNNDYPDLAHRVSFAIRSTQA